MFYLRIFVIKFVNGTKYGAGKSPSQSPRMRMMKAVEIRSHVVNTSLGNFITILFSCAEGEEGVQREGHVHSSCLVQPDAVLEGEGKRGLVFTASCQCSFSHHLLFCF